MRESRIANCVEETLFEAERGWGLCKLSAWVVMPNHVHVLLFPYEELSHVMLVIKSASARRANPLLERSGQRFWQDESFDHWVRDGHQRRRIIRYIEANPVTAGLVVAPEDWRWSSAWARNSNFASTR
jgi:REP element-mobilizing transposase RayT